MEKFIKAGMAVTLVMAVLGVLMKLNHYPGASYLLTVSLPLHGLFLGQTFTVNGKWGKILLPVFIELVLCGALCMIMQWPYGKPLLFSGLAGSALVMFFFND